MISIIVPVYNAEKYIKRCIESVLNQDCTEWELLLVNDGSQDQSEVICKEFAQRDNRIHVISKKNGGPSSARNVGLINAKGDYIAFIDADDWIEKSFLSELLRAVKENDCDMAFCGWYTRNDKGEILQKDTKSPDIIFNISGKVLNDWEVPYTVWRVLYSANIIREKKVLFDESVYYMEDILFNFSYMQYAEKIIRISKLLYNWVVTPESLTRSRMDKEKFSRWFTKIDARMKICELKGLNHEVVEISKDVLLNEVVSMYRDMKKNKIYDKAKKDTLKQIMKKNRSRVFHLHSIYDIKRRVKLIFYCFVKVW